VRARPNRLWWVVPALAAVVLVPLIARWARTPEERERAPQAPPTPAAPGPRVLDAPSAPAGEPVVPKIPEDPVLREWRVSILRKDARGVERASEAFRAKEDEYRDRLVRLAREDAEPRVRAFTVTHLGMFRARPPEEFFIRSLEDPHEYPREAAIAALLRFGTRDSLEALDRVASSDPVERVRASAAAAAKSVRAK
jgi:HEAT repeat protein